MLGLSCLPPRMLRALLETALNFSGDAAAKANTTRCMKPSHSLAFDACDSEMWAHAAARARFDSTRAAGSELLCNGVWQTDRRGRPSSRFSLPCDERLVSPCRMDWFKLQRFEKVFNASSTRIVTKKGVKWVMAHTTCDAAAGMWLSGLEGHGLNPLSQSVPKKNQQDDALNWSRDLKYLQISTIKEVYFHTGCCIWHQRTPTYSKHCKHPPVITSFLFVTESWKSWEFVSESWLSGNLPKQSWYFILLPQRRSAKSKVWYFLSGTVVFGSRPRDMHFEKWVFLYIYIFFIIQ